MDKAKSEKIQETLDRFDELHEGMLKLREVVEAMADQEITDPNRDGMIEGLLNDATDRLEDMCVTGFMVRRLLRRARR